MPVGPRTNKILAGGIKDTGQPLPYRSDDAVDKVVGKRRRAVQLGTAFFGWPLWERYRTWTQHLDDVAQKRKGEK